MQIVLFRLLFIEWNSTRIGGPAHKNIDQNCTQNYATGGDDEEGLGVEEI